MTENLNRIYEEIFNKIIAFLSYNSRSVKEVADRLDEYFYRASKSDKSPAADISEEEKAKLKQRVIEELQSQNLLNDLDFAKTYIQQKTDSKKPINKMKIQLFLRKKGIPKEIIEEALLDFKAESELESANILADKKIKILLKHHDKNTAKKKLISFLYGKGFSSDIVYAVVDTKFKLK